MAVKAQQEAQNPLILRCNRLIEAFAKSDDERDFYLDRLEGFLIYIDLDKAEEELLLLERELEKNNERYCMIPKLTFYETKKIMEGFVNEKVYDIDTKEKLLDIIQSKEARENFLEFIYDHHSELEKWQTYYQERSRIRIIEWLRNNHFHFVFEEDLELPKLLIEKLKKELFLVKASKDVLAARKTLITKAKTYYSNEALNPRPKRGRPPKQAQKAEIEPQVTTDIYTTVPSGFRSFLFTPDLGSPSSATFSSKFGNEEELFSSRRIGTHLDDEVGVESLNQKLATLRSLSNKWIESESTKTKSNSATPSKMTKSSFADDFDEDDDEEDALDFDDAKLIKSRKTPKKLNGFKSSTSTKESPTPKASPKKATLPPAKSFSNKAPAKPAKANIAQIVPPKGPAKKPATKSLSKATTKISVPKAKPPTKPPAKSPAKKIAKPIQKATGKSPNKPVSPTPKKKPLRPIMKLKKKNKK